MLTILFNQGPSGPAPPSNPNPAVAMTDTYVPQQSIGGVYGAVQKMSDTYQVVQTVGGKTGGGSQT
jgi:hypothetical protein